MPTTNTLTVIAIDGPAAAGKGTLARGLAAALAFDYLDTGLIYRAVGMKAARDGLEPAVAARKLMPRDLEDPSLRSDEAAQAASKVASIPEVRAALLDFQRTFAQQPPCGRGAVLDGRDIGTTSCHYPATVDDLCDGVPGKKGGSSCERVAPAGPGSYTEHCPRGDAGKG